MFFFLGQIMYLTTLIVLVRILTLRTLHTYVTRWRWDGVNEHKDRKKVLTSQSKRYTSDDVI